MKYYVTAGVNHHHPSTTRVDGTFMDISSQTPRFAIAVLRSLVDPARPSNHFGVR